MFNEAERRSRVERELVSGPSGGRPGLAASWQLRCFVEFLYPAIPHHLLNLADTAYQVTMSTVGQVGPNLPPSTLPS